MYKLKMIDVKNKSIEIRIVNPEPKYIKFIIIIAIPLIIFFSVFLLELFGVELGVPRLFILMAIVGLIIPFNKWRNKYAIIGKIIFKNHVIVFEKEFEDFAVELTDIKKIVIDYDGYQSEIVSKHWTDRGRFAEGIDNVLYFEFINQFRSSEKLFVFLEDVVQKENLFAYLNYYERELKVKINYKA